MCGIIGGISERNVANILIEGLKRLEYRGYDSAGLALVNENAQLLRYREQGKVAQLEAKCKSSPIAGNLGVAHTRWATHGVPSENNAHPHVSCDDIALVHNGIIDNFLPLKEKLTKDGFTFTSDTDSEVIVHAIAFEYKKNNNLYEAVRRATANLSGAYSIAVISKSNPNEMVVARHGSPLVIGIGFSEHFVASDPLALVPVTRDIVVLEDGDIAKLTTEQLTVYDKSAQEVTRPIRRVQYSPQSTSRGEYRHFMAKEIYEQPEALANALEGRLVNDTVCEQILGPNAAGRLDKVEFIQFLACGTSYHATIVAERLAESVFKIPARTTIASEFRGETHVLPKNTLIVAVSQSGETADTLAALRSAGDHLSCAICNVPESSLVRECELNLLTHAGPEIGVASTKAFTTQILALVMLLQCVAKNKGETGVLKNLRGLPTILQDVLSLDEAMKLWAHEISTKKSTLFVGRGPLAPIAMEGALKLKELSYIHAEAYPAGELKHGPLALVDDEMPVVALIDKASSAKMCSNIEEIEARAGKVYAITTQDVDVKENANRRVVKLPFDSNAVHPFVATILYVVPMQLLSYHVAVYKGTDVDQPRNLAKSVTVE